MTTPGTRAESQQLPPSNSLYSHEPSQHSLSDQQLSSLPLHAGGDGGGGDGGGGLGDVSSGHQKLVFSGLVLMLDTP